MIIALANKKLEVSIFEKEYLDKLKDQFGESVFNELFETDSEGFIHAVTPSVTKPIQMVVLFSILNIMINQRLRKFDNTRFEELEGRIIELEAEVKMLKLDKN